jgi:NADH-quinone oxidoreductase subunit G
MATIYIENNPYEVEERGNLLTACLSLGFNVPYFCWHPALHSVGSCRLCAVKQFRNEEDTRGQIVMSCMTPVTDGLRISIDDPEVREFRAAVLEWLMSYHPHDCPVCDEGGECHLQDMTVMTGHNYRRYRFTKLSYQNQDLGPFVNHEMNRCIKCYRCVRFYRDYAGGRDFNVYGIGHRLYFGRFEDGTLENEFSGNLVEICPTGVFTDKTFRKHFTRKWDLQTAPSICVHCGLGCNIEPGERYGTLRRVRNRYHHEINGYFLCDRGRFGYEFVNHEHRVRSPLVRSASGKLESVSAVEALQRVTDILSDSKRVIGIGSPRASVESNFALRSLVGPDRFCAGLSQQDLDLVASAIAILQQAPSGMRTLREAELSDAVLVLGEDVTNTAPRLALSLRQSILRQPMAIAERLRIPEWNARAVRQAIQDEKGPLFIATVSATRLDEKSARTFRGATGDIARLGFAVAARLDRDAPPVEGLSAELQALAAQIADALAGARRPLVVSGLSSRSQAVLDAAERVRDALCRIDIDAGLFLTMPECNSFGLGLMGGNSLEAAFRDVHSGEADTVIVLENDLFRRYPSQEVERFLHEARHVIVIDHLLNPCASRADVVLPAATFAEGQGTLVNCESRGQRFFRVFSPAGDVRESWKWIRGVLHATGSLPTESWDTFDDLAADVRRTMPVFENFAEVAPNAGFRITGQKVPRQPHRYSGRTSMLANVSVHEPKPPGDPDSALVFSMEGSVSQAPPALVSRVWAPGWNSVQALNKFQSEVGGAIRGGDAGVRFLTPLPGDRFTCGGDIPPPFQRSDDRWYVVPLYHIFGSEELSMLSPAVAERATQPYLGLNPSDAEELGLEEGARARLTVQGVTLELTVRIMASLPFGVAGLPVGLPGLTSVPVPDWGAVEEAK